MQSYAPAVLFVAMLFAFGNLAHALEHDYGASLGQNHAECNHCSGDQSAAVSHTPISTLSLPVVLRNKLFVSAYVAAPTPTFQARAPPLS